MNSLVNSLHADNLRLAIPTPPPAPLRPRVSVVMVVYMTGPALADSVAHVLADPLVDEFIIVDNGSPPDVARWLRELTESEDRIHLVQGQGNVGFARGANLGARAARGEGLLFLNPDAFLQPGCIKALAAAAEGRPSPCVIGGRVLNEDGSEQRGGRRGEVTPITTLLTFSQLSLTTRGLRRFEIHRESEPLPMAPAPMPTISGACFYMRSADFAQIGGFDEGFFLHVEDIDLCWRARQAGGIVLFHPHATVIHLGSTSRKHPLAIEWHKGRGLVRYFLKRSSNLGHWALAVVFAPLIMLASVLRPALRTVTAARR